MCGGAGTRLWPASRENRPKQFLPLFGHAVDLPGDRAQGRPIRLCLARPIVVTNGQYRFLVAEQLAAIGAEADILLEPVRRDSGPAIAAGAGLCAPTRRRWRRRRRACRRPRRHRSGGVRQGLHAWPAPPPQEDRIVMFGVEPTRAGDRIRLHPARRAARSGPVRRSNGSSKSPTPRPRRVTWPRAICGTPAISCFARASCWTNTAASSRTAPRRSRRRSKSAGTDLGFVTLEADAFGAGRREIDRLRGDGAHRRARR